MQETSRNGRYQLDEEEGQITVNHEGQPVFQGNIEELRELAIVLNRFLLYGEKVGEGKPAAWLSTGDALALSQRYGGPGKDAIRYAARNGRFVAEKDASERWRYERASFMRWLLDDAAHQPGRKE
ncbi:MAG: hypothetical protein IT327_02680 [Anaerolineae bacterium]|nr:hypothetical protein [Anaerolineae bacterium]